MTSYKFYELIDDLGQDFYRVDDSTQVALFYNKGLWSGQVPLTFSDLKQFSEAEHCTLFQEVTEDDVR